MSDYLKEDKKKRLKGQLIKIIIILLVFLCIILSYITYDNIKISHYENNDIKIEKTVQTIEETKKEDKTVISMIQDINESIVGISKVKNIGSSIFSAENISDLGLGTGVIVSSNGYILTNAHVSGEKYSTCYVTHIDGNTYKGNVVWSNADIDLSIVKIDKNGLKEAMLGDSDKIQVGESVYAIGNPIGFEFQRTVTAGIVSALNRTIKFEENEKETYMEDLIQTDATINPGNSGGPLINLEGEIIGINGVKITSAEGISFAIPINSVKSVIKNFKETGKFEEASLGVFAFDKSVLGYIDTNLRFNEGIYVENVNNNSAAQKAGLKKGDIILSIDNKKLERMCDLRCYIYTKKPGDKVKLEVQRNYRKVEIEATLKKK